MTIRNLKSLKKWALTGAALTVIAQGAAFAQDKKIVEFDIDAQELGDALNEFGLQSGKEVYFLEADIDGKHTNGLEGTYSPAAAINLLLDDTGIQYRDNGNGTILIGEAYIRQASLEQESRPFRVAQLDQEDARNVETVRDRRKDDGDEQEKDVIVVTGTNIRGARTASPVMRFDKSDIITSGAPTVAEFIRRSVPQNFAAGASEQTFAANTSRADAGLNISVGSGVNLRGLGTDSTLVLINGRRMAPSSFGTFVDVSMIPTAAIDRVEILTDGASAIYGSEAVGGVTNFIMTEDYAGAETWVRYTPDLGNDFSGIQAGQTFGTGWESGNLLLSYEYRNRNRLDSMDREATALTPGPTDILPDLERHNLYVSLNQDLTDRIQLFSTALLSDRDLNFNIFNPFAGIAGESQFSVVDNLQYLISGGLLVDFSSSWRGEVVGTFGSSRADSRRPALIDDLQINKTTSYAIDAKIDREIFAVPGGAAMIAIGGQYRNEKMKTEDNLADFPEQDRNVTSVFGELFLPIFGDENANPGTERLEFTAAVRYEDYSDFGGTTNPKIGLLYSPSAALNFRGTWGTSFRAPRLEELSEIFNGLAIVDVTDSTVPAGVTISAVPIGNSADLQPEEATTWTIGADFQPEQISGLDINFTYFDIEFKNRIVQVEVGELFADPFSNPAFAPVISRDVDFVELQAIIDGITQGSFFDISSGQGGLVSAEAVVDLRLQNLASNSISGFDFNVSYGLDSDIGEWDFSFVGTYFTKYERRFSQDAPSDDILGTVYNPPNLRLRGGVGWSYNGLSANTYVNFVDGFEDMRFAAPRSVSPWATIDLQLGLDVGKATSSNTLNGLRLSISANNLFNEKPPFVEDLVQDNKNFDPENHDILGRIVAFSATYTW